MNIRSKYPRTVHFPWSRTVGDDDVTAESVFVPGQEVVVSEKMDGENTTFYTDGFHARSMDSLFHPSRSWVAGFHGGISWMIPENRRIVVENVYARHSVAYDDLPTFAFGISVVDVIDGIPTFLDWDETMSVFNEMGITSVPVLYRGPWDEKVVRNIFNTQDHTHHEGIVVRSADRFAEADFANNVRKAVRKSHVQTDQHWTRTWVPNHMAK